MGVAVYLPLLAALVLGTSAGQLARALAPRAAARALTFSAVLVTIATSFVLAVLAFTLLATLSPVAALGRWSVASLSAADPVPQLVAAVACAAVLLLGTSGARAAVRRGRALAAARALCQTLGGEPGQLVILDDGRDDVYALPGDRGRIVASRGLLAALPTDERRALLAHETAHLRGRHHLYRAAVELAAAVNPLLRPVVGAVRFATERWADEDAATATGDRAAVARALARVGLRRHATAAPAGWRTVALEGADSAVVARVRALLTQPPRRRPAPLVAHAALAAVLVVTVASTVETQRDAEHLFEQARPTVTAGAATRSDAPALHR
jgi:peptidase M48-like protein